MLQLNRHYNLSQFMPSQASKVKFSPNRYLVIPHVSDPIPETAPVVIDFKFYSTHLYNKISVGWHAKAER